MKQALQQVLAATGLCLSSFACHAALTVYAGGGGGIPVQGLVNPYPLVIEAGGGTIVDVDVKLKGLWHTYPDDLDILLVGPQGQQVMLMSDVGGAVRRVRRPSAVRRWCGRLDSRQGSVGVRNLQAQ